MVDKWRRQLAATDGFRIGIAWQGSQIFFPIVGVRFPWPISPLARLPGVRLISLQKGSGSEQVAAVDFPVVDLSGRLDEVAGPFMDTAAVIRNLDLVVAPDTAVAHLAGALGAPVWLASFSSDWRWLLGRDDSPVVSDHATFPPNRVRRLARRDGAHRQGRRAAVPKHDNSFRSSLVHSQGYGVRNHAGRFCHANLPPELFQSVSPGSGPIVAVVGDAYQFLVVGSQTAGRYAIWEAVVPSGGGPPLHMHSRESEGFLFSLAR